MKKNWTAEENTRVQQAFNELLAEIHRAKNESRIVPSPEVGEAEVAVAVAEFKQVQAEAIKEKGESSLGSAEEETAVQKKAVLEAAIEVTDAIINGDAESVTEALDNMAAAGRKEQLSEAGTTVATTTDKKIAPSIVSMEARPLTREDGNPYEGVEWEFIIGDSQKKGTTSKNQVRGRVLFGGKEMLIGATVADDKREVVYVIAPRLQYIPGHIQRIRDAIDEWLGTRTEEEWARLMSKITG